MSSPIKLYTIFTYFLLLTIKPIAAGELEDIVTLKNKAQEQLITLKSTGVGHKHPEILAKEKEIRKLEHQIENLESSFEEVVILIKGTSSYYLKGHQKFGKSETALTQLLLNNWKIQNIVSAGDEKAYVWLTRK